MSANPMRDRGLPLQGQRRTYLPDEPRAAVEGLREVERRRAAADAAGAAVQLRQVLTAHPAFLAGWAELSETALRAGDVIEAYAFARTGYHRGLDAIRRAGWRGEGAVPWGHEANRGFLRSVYALLQAASALGEQDEQERLRQFLLDLDPGDPFRLGAT